MTLVLKSPSEKEVRQEIKAIKAASAKVRMSKATARAYLIKHGYITKSGKLTKTYGG